MASRTLRLPKKMVEPSLACLLAFVMSPFLHAQAPAKIASQLVRDPSTGRLFKQHVETVEVPVSRWEYTTAKQKVYVPSVVVKNYPTQRTVYTPNTQYVLQPRVRGLLNPFRQPVYTYEYVPVTTWVATIQTVNHQVPTREYVATEQTVSVPKLVQTTEKRQRLVQTEIPQPGVLAAVPTLPPVRPPLVRIPLLAQQRLLPWPARSAPAALPVANGLRPITPVLPMGNRTASYSAPMRTSAPSAQMASRSAMQAGMSATVLR